MMLTGNNGILQQATIAKESTDSLKIQERINLAYHSSLIDGQGKTTEPLLESELKKEFNKTTLDDGWLDKTSVEGKWKITIDGISLNVPVGIEQLPIQVDESEKLYNVLKDKTPQEIVNGVIIDGIETKFITASGTEATIEYNNQEYIVSLDPSTGSIISVILEGNITFTIQNEENYTVRKGLTFRQWIEEMHPTFQGYQIKIVMDNRFGGEYVMPKENCQMCLDSDSKVILADDVIEKRQLYNVSRLMYKIQKIGY